MTATDPTAAQPATPGQALHRAADQFDEDEELWGWEVRGKLAELAAALAAAPAVYTLPAEPPDGTRLKDRSGGIWERDGRYIAPWTLVVTFRGETPSAPVRRHWHELLMAGAPLVAAPPAGTETQ